MVGGIGERRESLSIGSSRRRVGNIVDLVLFEQAIESAPTDAKCLGRPRFISTVPLVGFQNVLAIEFIEFEIAGRQRNLCSLRAPNDLGRKVL